MLRSICLLSLLSASALLLSPFRTSDAQTGSAGECRASLRPLLLQPNPDPGQLRLIRQLCQTEADAGDPVALYQLSFFYLGLENWNAEKAASMVLSAAQAGVPEAQYWLAWQYEAGPLLPNDPSLALHWYQLAAENNHRLALQRLAEAYENGSLGLAADTKKASLYRARAAQCAEQTS